MPGKAGYRNTRNRDEFDKGNTVSEHIEDSEVFKMLGIVVASLVGFFVVIVIIAQLVGDGKEGNVDKMVEAATIERIKPFGEINIGTEPVFKASTGVDGKGTYTSACFACHGTGAAGAPKYGDKAAWKSRIAAGMKTLFNNAINGTSKGMPPKGGNASLSDAAVKAAVKYMVKGSK